MRYFAALVTVSCLLAGAWSETATASNHWIGYQGLLTDGGSTPVPDGPHDLTLSIWTDSVGGSMLHSELVTVTTTKGLFTTALGRGASPLPDIFTDQPLYLQTQVSGQAAMTPRVGIGTSAYAMSSSSLHGEATSGSARARGIITTKPTMGGGSLATGSVVLYDADSDGDGKPDYLLTDSVSTSSASSTMSRDADDDGTSDQSISQSVIPGVSAVAIKTKGTGADKNRVIGSTYPDSANLVIGRDTDGDGVDDRSITQSVIPGSSSVAINTKGTGADKNRIAGSTYPDSAVLLVGRDTDGDGQDDRSISQSVKPGECSVAIKTKGTGADKNRVIGSSYPDSANVVIGRDTDGDGSDDRSISQSVIPTSSSVAIQTKGTGADKNRVISTAYPDSAVHVVLMDTNGDGISDESVSLTVLPGTSSMAIKTKGTGADNNRVVSSAYPDSARQVIGRDSDGDGIDDRSITQSVIPGSCGVAIQTKGTGADKNRVISTAYPDSAVHTVLMDTNGDGTNDESVSLTVLPGTSSVAINTKGTGADKGRVASTAYPDSAFHVVVTDTDGDGIDDESVTTSVMPGVSSVAIKTKGTGADANRIVTTAYEDSVVHELTMSDLAGVMLMKAKEKASRTKCSSNLRVTAPSSTAGRDDDCDSASARTAWSQSGGGTTSSLTIEASSTADPILHSSGAKLTAGGVWTNASDVALKENFHPVDGERILEQVAALPISEWNYKSEPETVKHIGPTAQDFQAAFGVGSDNKTISTIDPSGIALVAVQELRKENQELKAQMAELRKMYEELARKK